MFGYTVVMVSSKRKESKTPIAIRKDAHVMKQLGQGRMADSARRRCGRPTPVGRTCGLDACGLRPRAFRLPVCFLSPHLELGRSVGAPVGLAHISDAPIARSHAGRQRIMCETYRVLLARSWDENVCQSRVFGRGSRLRGSRTGAVDGLDIDFLRSIRASSGTTLRPSSTCIYIGVYVLMY